MKKIIFCDIPMQSELKAMNYKENNKIYSHKSVYAINACIAEELKFGDEVKIILLKKKDLSGNSTANEAIFKKEFDAIIQDKKIKTEYKIIETPFEETRSIHEKLLRDMVGELEEKAEIYADITYGPKPLPIIMFSVLTFADKFFDCDIKRIVYGKVDFIKTSDGVAQAVNPVIYDVTPLYYLNSVANTIDCNSSDEAVKILDVMLSM